MSLDPEELRRRRYQQKRKRQIAQRKLILRLCIAAAVLVLCGVLILVFSLRNSPPAAENPEETVAPTQSGETAPEATVPPPTVIHFAATGNLNVTKNVVESGGSEYDYTKTFLDIAHVLANADLTTVNFEGNLCGAPYGSSASAPQSMMEALKNAGVDMIQLANSYSINRGVSGLITTIDNVEKAGMEPVGVFRDQEEYEKKQGFSLFEVEGIRIAVVSFTKGMVEGTTLPRGNENCVNVLYTDYDSTYQKIDKEKIKEVMEAVEDQEPDITIALLHWGSVESDNISKSQESIAKLLQEYGTDAVIGTHPRFVHQVNFNPEKGTLVAYSLGELIVDTYKDRDGSEYSVILDMEITKDHATGKTAITGFTYTPIFTVIEEGKPIRVLRIREAMAAYEAGYIDAVSKEIYDKMAYALMRVEQRIAGE